MQEMAKPPRRGTICRWARESEEPDPGTESGDRQNRRPHPMEKYTLNTKDGRLCPRVCAVIIAAISSFLWGLTTLWWLLLWALSQ